MGHLDRLGTWIGFWVLAPLGWAGGGLGYPDGGPPEGGAPEPAGVFPDGGPRPVTVGGGARGRDGVRESVHGRLDYRTSDGVAGGERSTVDRAAGKASFHRFEGDGILSIEWQMQFADGEGRLIHIERRDSQGETLIWREIGRLGRRTLRIHRGVDEDVWNWTEWTLRGQRRGSFSDIEGGCLPLLALDDGSRAWGDGEPEVATPPTRFWTFDPLTLGFVQRELTVEARTEIHMGSQGDLRIEGHDAILRELDGSPSRVHSVRADRLQGARWPGAGLEFRAFPTVRGGGRFGGSGVGVSPASAPREVQGASTASVPR